MTSPCATTDTATLEDLSVVPCKCCGGSATVYGAADFHRSCEDRHTPAFEPAGVDIPYHRCAACGFIFTIAFDHFTPEQFSAFIYNADYVRADPDFVERRPAQNALYLQQLFGHATHRLRVLDYGGGNGLLAERLRAAGFNAGSYDPFHGDSRPPTGTYDLVTAFEVLEHTTTPLETLAEMAGFLRPGGMLLFSTLLQPADIDQVRMNWWYAAPRNGHVSLYTTRALAALGDRLRLTTGSCGHLIHIAVPAAIPDWASRLVA